MRHPFVDGNKRTGAASALTFLFLNGYEIKEKYEEEFADVILAFVTHDIERSGLVEFIKERARQR